MKANDLLDLIGNVDDGILEEAEKKKRPAGSGWVRWTAAAACLCLVIGGFWVFVRTGGHSAPGGRNGAGGSGHNEGSVFMSYAGPVFPLTLREENSAISADRTITMDFAPWVPVWIPNEEEAASRADLTEEERQDVLNTYNAWYPEGGRYESSGHILVTDSYTLTNEDTQDQTFRVLYPFVSNLNNLAVNRPILTLNGEELETALHAGSYAGGFQGAWENGSTHDNPGSLNLDPYESWEGYRDLLADGTYLNRALGDFADFSEIPVTVYEFTDARGPESSEDDGIPNPTIRVLFELDYTQTKILSYGFNGGLYDEEKGIMGREFSIPEPGSRRYGVPRYLIVIGDDIENVNTRGYATGGWDTKKTVEAGVTVTRTESNLEDALRTAAAYWVQVQIDAGSRFGSDPDCGFELYFGLMKEHLSAYGVLSENAAARYANGMIEQLDVAAAVRVFWLEAEITIPAGSGVKLDAAFDKEPSFDFVCGAGNRGISGYDLVTGLGSNLTFIGQTAGLEDRGQIEIVRQNFGFDPANGITAVELDLNTPHYYLEVRKAGIPWQN